MVVEEEVVEVEEEVKVVELEKEEVEEVELVEVDEEEVVVEVVKLEVEDTHTHTHYCEDLPIRDKLNVPLSTKCPMFLSKPRYKNMGTDDALFFEP